MTPSMILLLAVLALGALVNLVAFVWNLVLCGRQGIGWLLLVLFVPFANLVFLIKFWSEAKRPFFLSLVGCGLVMLAVLSDPQGLAKNLGERFSPGFQSSLSPRFAAARKPPGASKPGATTAPSAPSETLQREQAAQEEAERRQRLAQETRASYDKHRAEADVLYKDLNTRRAKLKVDDAKAVAAFNAEAARYTALLEQTRVELATLSDTPPAVAASSPPPFVSPPKSSGPIPPAAKRGDTYVPGVVGGNPGENVPTGTPKATSPSLPRRSIDAARAARDAAVARTGEAGR